MMYAPKIKICARLYGCRYLCAITCAFSAQHAHYRFAGSSYGFFPAIFELYMNRLFM